MGMDFDSVGTEEFVCKLLFFNMDRHYVVLALMTTKEVSSRKGSECMI